MDTFDETGRNGSGHGARRGPPLLPLLVASVLCPTLHADVTEKGRGMKILVEEAPSLTMEISPARPSYAVGEPIALEVEGDRDFHLYLFTENLDTGERRMLLPAAGNEGNLVPAGAVVTMPPEGVVFHRDTPGRERVTAIGSIAPIEVDMSRTKSMDTVVGGEWAGDAMTGRGRHDVPAGMAIAELDIDVIAPAPPLPASSADAPLAFVSSSCTRCPVERRMRIGFGADRAGLVTVLVVEPDGTSSELVSREVDGTAMQFVPVIPEAPLGAHSLVAVYTDSSTDRDKSLDAILGSVETKGLRLAESSVVLPPHAVRRFDVVEP